MVSREGAALAEPAPRAWLGEGVALPTPLPRLLHILDAPRPARGSRSPGSGSPSLSEYRENAGLLSLKSRLSPVFLHVEVGAPAEFALLIRLSLAHSAEAVFRHLFQPICPPCVFDSLPSGAHIFPADQEVVGETDATRDYWVASRERLAKGAR